MPGDDKKNKLGLSKNRKIASARSKGGGLAHHISKSATGWKLTFTLFQPRLKYEEI